MGFGTITSDYFIGNEALYVLTRSITFMLRVDMWDDAQNYYYAEYGMFKVYLSCILD